MSFPISPGVSFREIDLSGITEEISASNGVIAGKFAWGPVKQPVRISNEGQLVAVFGKPSDAAYVDFMTASSFLAYSNALDVVRIGSDTLSINANASGTTTVSILNDLDYEAGAPAVTFLARYPGAAGNGLQVFAAGSANQYEYLLPGTFVFTTSKTAVYTPADDPAIAGTLAETLAALVAAGDQLVVGGVAYTVASVATNTVTFTSVYVGATSETKATKRWKYASLFTSAPEANEAFLVVVDSVGTFGEAGAVLESFRTSLTVGEKNTDGTPKYYKDVLFGNSGYILAGSTPITFGAGDNLADVFTMSAGSDTFGSLTIADYIAGYTLFGDASTTDVAFIIGGDALTNPVLGQYLVQNIAEVRKDCVVFLSPQLTSKTAPAVIADRNQIGSSSYATMDSGWKYMYDRYNDKNRWVPLNGDHAGVYARVDREYDPWVSAGGTTKGRFKNVIKLNWNPDQSARDTLYTNGVNPVASQPGVGPYVNGDKTLQVNATAFNRMNVRRLFILIEKSITTAAAQILFEVNDEFTQRRFVSMTEPLLRDIKGRRGLETFLVIADSSVNTAQVRQQNRFVGQIFVKPLYSINFIRLDFVAVNAAMSFEEVIVGG